MAVINERFIGVGKFLRTLSPWIDFERVFIYLYQEGANTAPHLRGMLKPLVRIKDDFGATFKAYPTQKALRRDVFQPLIGLWNILRGVMTLICAPMLLVFSLVGLFAGQLNSEKGLPSFFLGVLPLSWVVNGTLDIVRGVTQIVTSPLTWVLRIPLRGLLTKVTVYQAIEHPGVRRGINLIREIEGSIYEVFKDTRSGTYFRIRGRNYYEGIAKIEAQQKNIYYKLHQGQALGWQMPNTYIDDEQGNQGYKNVKWWMFFEKVYETLPDDIKPFVMVAAYKALTGDEKDSFQSNIPPDANPHWAAVDTPPKCVSYLSQWGLFNTSKVFLMAWEKSWQEQQQFQNQQRLLGWLPKDVAQLIAKDYLRRPPYFLKQPQP